MTDLFKNLKIVYNERQGMLITIIHWIQIQDNNPCWTTMIHIDTFWILLHFYFLILCVMWGYEIVNITLYWISLYHYVIILFNFYTKQSTFSDKTGVITSKQNKHWLNSVYLFRDSLPVIKFYPLVMYVKIIAGTMVFLQFRYVEKDSLLFLT